MTIVRPSPVARVDDLVGQQSRELRGETRLVPGVANAGGTHLRAESVPGARAPGALDGALDGALVPGGPDAATRGHGDRPITAATVLALRGGEGVSVLTGGPGHSPVATVVHLVAVP